MGTTPSEKNFNGLQNLYKHFRRASNEFNTALDNLVAPSALSILRRAKAAERLENEAQEQQQLKEEARQLEEMAHFAAAKANNKEINPDDDNDYTPNEGSIEKPNFGEPSESNIFSLIFF